MLGRPPRRQPGAHRPDGPGPQAPDVRHRRGDGLQGDRGRASRRPASPTSTSSGSSSRRTSSPTTSPSRCSRSAGPSSSSAPTSACRAPATRSSTSTTPRRSSSAGWCSASTRTASPQIATDAAKLCRKLEPTLAGHQRPLRVQPGELHRHRDRLRHRDLRGGERRHRARHRAADPEPAGHRRDVHAEPLRRRHRVLPPQRAEPRSRSACRCTRTTTRAPAWRPPQFGDHGRRRPRGGHALRQRRAHRQRRRRSTSP